jgi:HK97 family phage portal protein
MGLARLLTRSGPNVVPTSLAPSPAPGATFAPGPEQTWPPSATLPQPSEASALSVPAFWRGAAYVCGSVGMLPVTAYRDTDALDPQPPVIRQPDPNQTSMAFWAGCTESLTLYGNSICIVTSRDRLGWPQTLRPIHPTLAAVRFTGNPMAPTIDQWYIAGQMYDPGDIWHIKSHLGRPGWPLGRGLIDTGSDAIATALALQSYAASYFNNSGMPSGILKIHRPEVTQAQADATRSAWITKYAGTPSVAVLNELTDFTPVSFRPVDSQMIESRAHSLIEVALMWGIPPSKLGATVGGGTYRNAEMEEVQARNDAVAPWTELLAQAGSLELLPRGQHLQWDLGASLRTDTLSLYQAYQFALGGPGPQSQWLLVDEIRAKQNLDPISDVADELGVAVPAGVEDEPAPEPPAVPSPPVMAPLVPPDNPSTHPSGAPVGLSNGKG